MRAKAVTDGNPVNILEPQTVPMGGRIRISKTGNGIQFDEYRLPGKANPPGIRLKLGTRASCEGSLQVADSRCQEKPRLG